MHGPRRGPETLFIQTRDWLGERGAGSSPDDPDQALAVLATRYFAAYGPATVQDFAHWAGVTVARARTATAMVGPRLRSSGPEPGLLDVDSPEPAAGMTEPAPLRLSGRAAGRVGVAGGKRLSPRSGPYLPKSWTGSSRWSRASESS